MTKDDDTAVTASNVALHEAVPAVAGRLAHVAFRVPLGLPPRPLDPARGLLQARLVRTQR